MITVNPEKAKAKQAADIRAKYIPKLESIDKRLIAIILTDGPDEANMKAALRSERAGVIAQQTAELVALMGG